MQNKMLEATHQITSHPIIRHVCIIPNTHTHIIHTHTPTFPVMHNFSNANEMQGVYVCMCAVIILFRVLFDFVLEWIMGERFAYLVLISNCRHNNTHDDYMNKDMPSAHNSR